MVCPIADCLVFFYFDFSLNLNTSFLTSLTPQSSTLHCETLECCALNVNKFNMSDYINKYQFFLRAKQRIIFVLKPTKLIAVELHVTNKNTNDE